MQRSSRLRRVTGVVLLLVLGRGQATRPAQTAPPAEFRDSVEVVEVLVEVSVTDRRGAPIFGLGLGDFVVEEDGRQVEVTHVEPLTAAARSAPLPSSPPAAAGARSARPVTAPPPGHNYILLLHHLLFESDRATLGATSRKFGAVRDLRQWVREGLGDGDCMAVLAYDSRLKPVLDFSSDRKQLDRAIRRALMERTDSRRPEGQRLSCPSLFPHLPRDRDLRDRTTTVAGGLATLAQAADSVEGRKHLLLFSLGVGLNAGRGSVPGSVDTLSWTQALNAARVTAHTMDLTPPRVAHSMQVALQELAWQTGGRYFGRSIAFSVPLQAIDAQLAASYRIAFRAPRAAAAVGYRTIDVRTTMPSLRVSSPRGYRVRETWTVSPQLGPGGP